MSAFKNDEIDPAIFSSLTQKQLIEIEMQLVALRKHRRDNYIKPERQTHINPILIKHIRPLMKEHIEPINKTLRLLRKYLPNDNKFFNIKGTIFGPTSKRNLIKSITETEQKVDK